MGPPIFITCARRVIGDVRTIDDTLKKDYTELRRVITEDPEINLRKAL
jgi:hypothetical protein